MIPITHKLKIYKEYADAIISGEKTFEVRLNDRRYAVGDTIEFIQVNDGRPIVYHPILGRKYKITYLLTAGMFGGLKEDYCVFSIKEVTDNAGHNADT